MEQHSDESGHIMDQHCDGYSKKFASTFSVKFEDDELSALSSTDDGSLSPDDHNVISGTSSIDQKRTCAGRNNSDSSWTTVSNPEEILSNSSFDDERLSAMLANLKVKFKLQYCGHEKGREGHVRFETNSTAYRPTCNPLTENSNAKENAGLNLTTMNNTTYNLAVKSLDFNRPIIERTNSARSLCQLYDENVYCPQFSTFKAKPIPKHLLDNTINEKMLQEKEFRKIRIKIRAEEMLRSSASPIPIRRRVERACSAQPSTRRAVSPCQNPPDFKALHFKLARDLGRKTPMKVSTVCKPFNLMHSNRSDELEVVNVKMVKATGEVTKVRNNLNSIPAKMTTAAQLRDSSNR